MATLASLKKQIEALTKKAEAIRKTEVAAAIKTIRDLVSQFGLTAQDVGLASGRGRGKVKAVSAPKAVGVPKYRDPKTGKTWTGHGKPPGWIAGAADRSKFLIDGQGGAATTAAPKAAKAPKGAKVAKAIQATAVKAAAPAKKASAKKLAAEKTPAVKQPTRAPKAAAKPAAPAKKASAVPKAGKPAAKKAATAKVQDKAADATAPAEAA